MTCYRETVHLARDQVHLSFLHSLSVFWLFFSPHLSCLSFSYLTFSPLFHFIVTIRSSTYMPLAFAHLLMRQVFPTATSPTTMTLEMVNLQGRQEGYQSTLLPRKSTRSARAREGMRAHPAPASLCSWQALITLPSKLSLVCKAASFVKHWRAKQQVGDWALAPCLSTPNTLWIKGGGGGALVKMLFSWINVEYRSEITKPGIRGICRSGWKSSHSRMGRIGHIWDEGCC